MNNKHYMKLEKIQNNMIFNRKLVWRVWSIWLFLNLSLLIIASRQTAEAGSRIPVYILLITTWLIQVCGLMTLRNL